MTRILHLSDLHFGCTLADRVAGVIERAHALSPGLVIVSGDLTQRARRAEFIEAAAFLRALPTPALVVPGNHDLSTFRIHERLLYPWAKWRRWMGRELEPERGGPGFRVVGINTARRGHLSFDWSRGRINQRQIERARTLARSDRDATLGILVAHHPFWLPEGHAHRGLIGGRKRALQRLQPAGPDLILSGHVHLDYCQIVAGMIVSHAGTTTSSRLLPGHPNSFNIIEGDHRELIISNHHWTGATFEPIAARTFVRREKIWHER